MTRADYGGDGRTHTRDGISVYICDRFGFRPCHKDAPLAFEAAWGKDGASCVARPRIAEAVSLEQLAERYPRLKPRLGPAACTDDGAARPCGAAVQSVRRMTGAMARDLLSSTGFGTWARRRSRSCFSSLAGRPRTFRPRVDTLFGITDGRRQGQITAIAGDRP